MQPPSPMSSKPGSESHSFPCHCRWIFMSAGVSYTCTEALTGSAMVGVVMLRGGWPDQAAGSP